MKPERHTRDDPTHRTGNQPGSDELEHRRYLAGGEELIQKAAEGYAAAYGMPIAEAIELAKEAKRRIEADAAWVAAEIPLVMKSRRCSEEEARRIAGLQRAEMTRPKGIPATDQIERALESRHARRRRAAITRRR